MAQIANDTQLHRVLNALLDAQWHTLTAISTKTGDTPSSIASRIRDLRLPVYGGHNISARQNNGQWEYKLNTAVTAQPVTAPPVVEPQIKFIDTTTMLPVFVPKSKCKITALGKFTTIIAHDDQGQALANLVTTESQL